NRRPPRPGNRSPRSSVPVFVATARSTKGGPMQRGGVRRFVMLPVALALGAAAVGIPRLAGAAESNARIRLLPVSDELTITHFPREGLILDLGVYVAVSEAPLDLRVGRADATSPLRIAQAI